MQVYRCQWNKNHQQSTQHISKELFYKNRVQKGVAFIGATCRYHRHGDCPRLDLFLFLPAGSQFITKLLPVAMPLGTNVQDAIPLPICTYSIYRVIIFYNYCKTAIHPQRFCFLRTLKSYYKLLNTVLFGCCQTLHLPFQDHRLVLQTTHRRTPSSSNNNQATQPTPRIGRRGQTENLGFFKSAKEGRSQKGATNSYKLSRLSSSVFAFDFFKLFETYKQDIPRRNSKHVEAGDPKSTCQSTHQLLTVTPQPMTSSQVHFDLFGATMTLRVKKPRFLSPICPF